MPVRDRRYENLLQFIFGGLIFLALLYAAINAIWQALHYLILRWL